LAVISKTAASLRFFADGLDPDEITAALGKAPTVKYRKGETIESSNGEQRIARTGRWSLETEPRVPGDLDQQIAEILQGTTNDFEVWRALTKSYRADVFCGLFMETQDEGLELSPETTLALGRRGLVIGLCLYAPD